MTDLELLQQMVLQENAARIKAKMEGVPYYGTVGGNAFEAFNSYVNIALGLQKYERHLF